MNLLDGVTSLDLSGVTGQIHYNYDSASLVVPQILMSLAALFFLILLALGIMSLFSTSKTRKYREQLVDMYVSATIRKFAKEDNLDLSEEYKTFIKESKRQKLSEDGLSKVVEDELSEKVIEQQDNKLNEKKK